MNINRSNYEIYFLDYLDGNLPDNQIDDFLDFLKNNPDLHDELKAVSAIELPAEKIAYSGKESLLKNELTGTSQFDYQAVAFIEEDLNQEDSRLFLDELSKDPQKEEEFDLFLKARLVPDKAIVFDGKKHLYKQTPTRMLWKYSSRVAAVLVLLLGVWTVWQSSFDEPVVVPVADNHSVDEPRVSAPDIVAATEKTVENEPQTVPQKQVEHAVEPLKAKQPQVVVADQIESVQLDPIREQAPEPLALLEASVESGIEAEALALHGMEEYIAPSGEEYLTIPEYLAEKVLHKSKEQPFTFSNVLSAGLDAVATVSQDRVDYKMNDKGNVTAVRLNTRLLAFSIPFKKGD